MANHHITQHTLFGGRFLRFSGRLLVGGKQSSMRSLWWIHYQSAEMVVPRSPPVLAGSQVVQQRHLQAGDRTPGVKMQKYQLLTDF
eukprot:SAG22_NODE_560_length_9102_cov_54.310785_12_plen_86_part_00